MYGSIACFMVRIRARIGDTFLTRMNLINVLFSCCLQRLFKGGLQDGRPHDHVITKISRIDGLPHFLTNGAPHARSSAIMLDYKYVRSLFPDKDRTKLFKNLLH